jgi:uracil-DNA glycosylase
MRWGTKIDKKTEQVCNNITEITAMISPNDITTDWYDKLVEIYENHKSNIEHTIKKDETVTDVYPARHLVFNAFKFFDMKELKVVIIGQDCYHSVAKNGLPLACGLAFSVPQECATTPPSLRVIFKELEHEYGIKRTNSDLSDWCSQGVLLLNCGLTVRKGTPNSHMKVWKPFTSALLTWLGAHSEHTVYILWGEFAKAFAPLISTDEDRNMVLTCRHPSPLAQNKGPFVGNNHFKITNDYLTRYGKEPIKWV